MCPSCTTLPCWLTICRNHTTSPRLPTPFTVFSATRLRQEFYGLPQNEVLVYERCEKEALHELGHTFGLLHCRDSRCAMARSSTLKHVDAKRPHLCETCRALFLENADEIGDFHEQEEHADPADR